MLAMQTANEYGLLDSVCAPYLLSPAIIIIIIIFLLMILIFSRFFKQMGSGCRSSRHNTIPSSRPWSWSASSKICVFYSHNNSVFLCQDHGHSQGGWQTSDEDHHDDILQFWYCGEWKFFSSKLLECFKSVTAVLSLSSTHLHKTESSKSSKMCGSLLACLVIAAASLTSW